MNKFQSHQIARIILKIRYGTATEKEKRIFDVWVKKREGRQALYDKVISDESLKEYLKLQSEYHDRTDYEKLQSGILHTLNKRNRQKQIKRYSLWCGSVAAVLLVTCMIIFNYIQRSEPPFQARKYIARVTPDTIIEDKVILVLANGEKVGVKGIQEDSLKLKTAVVVGQEDKLVYESRAGQRETDIIEELEINKIITTIGGFYSLILSDGTRVWLNSESELEYPVLFGEGERVVKLSGEAYFEVAPDTAHPFIVQTNDIRTRVLGTSFNINAYGNEPCVYTTLFTGKVEVTPLVDTTRKIVLTPGKQADWNLQEKRLTVAEADLDYAIAWKEGMFKFSKENIEVVTRQIERWYGVNFIYELANRGEYTFNGYFSKDEMLEAVLDVFTLTGGPVFKIEGNIVYVRDK